MQLILHLNSNIKFNLKWNRNNPKETEKETGKKGAFGPGLFYEPGPKALICPGNLLSRLGGPGWETGTKGLSQPGQKACSIVVM